MSRIRGFSLIELMVAVAIIGILSAIVLPSFLDYSVKANRSAAKSYLLEVASKQKLYFFDRRRYADSVTALGIPPPVEVSDQYTISVAETHVALAPPTFLITATPIPGKMQENDGLLSVNQVGAKVGKW